MTRKARFIIKTQKAEMEDIDLDSAMKLIENEIASLVRDGSDGDGDDSGELSDVFVGTGIGDGYEVFEFITVGLLSESESGKITLHYTDTEITGMQGCVTRIMFNRERPSFVVMVRDGDVSTSMSFEPQKQHITRYTTPYMTFDVCINTLSVDNRFDSDGEIKIDYLIEMRGLGVSRNILTISVKYDDEI